MPTIIAMDCSGSIDDISSLYFSFIDELVERYKDSPTLYYLWGSNYYKKSYGEIRSWINNKECPDGTYSIYIAQAVKNAGSSFWGHLIIVTDGGVGRSDITKCDDFIKSNNIRFKYVSTYVVGSGGNLSVGTPFTRGCANQTILIESGKDPQVKMQVSERALRTFERIEQINTYEEFRESYGKLSNSILAKMMGKDPDEELKSKLIDLKNRVLNSPILKKKPSLKEKFELQFKKLYDMANGQFSNNFSFDSISAFQANDDEDDD